jgi:hypothetical protein
VVGEAGDGLEAIDRLRELSVESKMGAVAHSPVSHPRSSNPACGFPALGFPTGFTSRHTQDGRFNR